jgi:hypothetical protein
MPATLRRAKLKTLDFAALSEFSVATGEIGYSIDGSHAELIAVPLASHNSR